MVPGLSDFFSSWRVRARVFLAFSIGCLTAEAEPSPVPVTIDGLVTQALARNPELRYYKAEIAVAKADRKSAGKLPNPELDLEVGRKKVTGGDAKAEGITYSVTLAQPIEWPGRLGLRKAIADRDIALAELGLERFSAYLAARVKVLGYALATQQENAATAAEVADRFTSVKEVVVQREPGGVAPMLEAKIIEAAEVVIQREAGEAAVEMQEALLELQDERQATGMAVGLNCQTGKPMLPEQEGVWDNVRVKRQSLYLSTVLANQLLLVDEVMRAGKQMGKQAAQQADMGM